MSIFKKPSNKIKWILNNTRLPSSPTRIKYKKFHNSKFQLILATFFPPIQKLCSDKSEREKGKIYPGFLLVGKPPNEAYQYELKIYFKVRRGWSREKKHDQYMQVLFQMFII